MEKYVRYIHMIHIRGKKIKQKKGKFDIKNAINTYEFPPKRSVPKKGISQLKGKKKYLSRSLCTFKMKNGNVTNT